MRHEGSPSGLPRPLCWGVLVLLFSAPCRAPDPHQGLAREWAEGPARWLLLEADRDALDRLRPGEWPRFLERFWASRARLAPLFAARVATADQLYGEEGVRGALSDRGGAFILLGEPRRLRVGEVTVPTPRGREGRRRSARVPSETWIYEREDLQPGLRELLAREEEETTGPVELVFLTEGRRTRLVYGSTALALAARAWVDSEPGETSRRSSVAEPRATPDEVRRDSR